jgi:protein O-GlcNAc transferase
MSSSALRKLERAKHLMLSGDLAAAASLCEEVLQRAPRNPDGLWLLGTLHLMSGRAAEALPLLEQCVSAAPGDGAALESLGVAQLMLGRYSAAEQTLRQALRLPRAPASVRWRLGMALLNQGRNAEAIQTLESALAAEPENRDMRSTLGQAYAAAGDLAAAAREFERLIARDPRDADALYNLGAVAFAAGDAERARSSFEAVLAREPGNIHAHEKLATLYLKLGRYREAIAQLREVGRAAPDDAPARNALAHALLQTGAVEEAMRMAREARSIDPHDAESYGVIAQAQHLTGALDEAARELELGFERTQSDEILGPLMHLAHRMCAWDTWRSAWERVAERLEQSHALGSPFALLAEATTPAQQLSYTRRWAAARFGPSQGSARQRVAGARDDQRLRIGYCSADFHQHPVASLLVEVLEQHDRSRFEVFAYSYGRDDGSALRKRLKRAVEHFVDVAWEPDDLLAQRLHRDRLDILIDLKGYTHGDRLQVMASRPARIQLSWLGYPGTTGAAFIDFVIADEWLIPPESERFYSERVLRMPHCYQPSDRSRAAAPTRTRAEYGLPADGFVFCCFNQAGKITPEVYESWMRLLKRVPDSVLWLLDDNRWASANLLEAAEAHGIACARVIIAPRLPPDEHLARYGAADLALDTHPYTSHTTANEALWMGCPLVALCGDTFAARVSSSIVRSCGFPELVTHTFQDYETLAYGLATDPAQLADIRTRLTQARDTVPLFDSTRFVRDLEALYTSIV